MIVNVKQDGFYYENEKIDDLRLYLQNDIEIDEKVTIEDIFDYLMSIEDIDEVFSHWTRGFKLKPFYDEMKEDNDSNFISIVLSWVPEIFEWEDDDCNKQSEFTEYVSVSGICGDGQKYGISLTSMSDLKDCSITLNNTWKLTKNYSDVITVAQKPFSLEDVIGGFLYEITFHGYPDSKKEVIDHLDAISERIESGEEEMIPHEKVRIGLLEKKLERLIENEKYEKAEKVKNEIIELSKKLDEGL